MITQKNFTQLLESFHFDYLVQYTSWFDDGPMELTVTILSSLQVLLNMAVIIILMLYGVNKKVNNSSYFIVNLAATDIVGFLVLIYALQIQESALVNKVSDPDLFLSEMAEGCHKQMALLSFSYLNTILATVFLTHDRYLFISKPFRYQIIVTKEAV